MAMAGRWYIIHAHSDGGSGNVGHKKSGPGLSPLIEVLMMLQAIKYFPCVVLPYLALESENVVSQMVEGAKLDDG